MMKVCYVLNINNCNKEKAKFKSYHTTRLTQKIFDHFDANFNSL